jgi:hypothetical protein
MGSSILVWNVFPGNYNTANGFQALYGNVYGQNNTANGSQTLYSNTGGSDNVAEGYQALYYGTDGSNNTALGYQAGFNFTGSESGNIDLGSPGVAGDNNLIRIGSGQSATYLASASFISGGSSQSTNNANFVWSDGAGIATASTNNNSVTFRATGGYRFFTGTNTTDGAILKPNATSWSSLSDRNAKKNILPINGEEVLEKLAAVPIARWNYKWENDSDVPNIGPMAQDFKHAFYPGRDDKSISTLEFDGVELAAIQGLNQKLEKRAKTLEQELTRKDSEMEKLQGKVADLQSQLDKLQRAVARLADKSAGTLVMDSQRQGNK